MGGDYNLHSRQWDTLFPTTSSQSNLAKVDALHGALGHNLISPPDVVTHMPDNINLRGSVIDLVWADADLTTSINIRGQARGLSDHAILDVKLQTPPWSLLGTPSITKGSDDEINLLAELAQSLSDILPSEEYPPSDLFGLYPIPYDPTTTLETATRLYQAYQDAWTSHAQPK
uniref:Endonuclease/exonuclease/phosphatase domain-containing protein n=1 Tax=Ganoderma boninense TaxID=34458 RepID=A0A5K1JW91_9APHY|nr:Uncharacterized protein [Ganoderma boninense]